MAESSTTTPAINGGGGGTAPAAPPPVNLIHTILRSLLIFTVVQYVSRQYRPSTTQPTSSSSSSPLSTSVDVDGIGMNQKPLGVTSPHKNNNRKKRKNAGTNCIWSPNTKLSLHVYITDVDVIDPIHDCREFRDTDHLLAQWHEYNLVLHAKDTPSKPFTNNNNKEEGNNDVVQQGYNNERHLNVTVPLSKEVLFNQTHVYAHACLIKEDDNNNGSSELKRDDILLKTFPITKHRNRRRVRDEKNLLEAVTMGSSSVVPSSVEDDDGSTHHADEEDGDVDVDDTIRSPLTIASMNRTHDQMLLYVKPSLTLQLVNVHSMPKFPSKQNIPTQMEKYMDWKVEDEDSDDGSDDGGVELFYPILHNSEFWITMDSMVEVNDTLTTAETTTTTSNNENDIQKTHHQPTTNTKNITLELHLQDINMWKWQFMSQMEESWRLQEDIEGDTGNTGGGGGMDVLRTMLLETNPILLIITAIVTVFHTLFDILAFKNDIKFFKGKRSMEGLSLRSMVVNTASMFVIFLYLMDNETSFMVLMSNGVGVAIECWKITKAVDISLRRRVKGNTTDNGDGDGVFWGAFGWEFMWEEKEGYKGSKTKEYDEIATSHLMYITMPLVTGYGMYSLLHQKHKGWYSWILNTLVGFIYMFGFVMMTPQLFINYKLQSVAHLNWRTLTYKSINTFIDDLFAFVIKMPIMHRLACLRDDVIFFIFCYQRYKYRTDYTRVNEFGQCEQPTEELLKEQQEEEEAKKETENGDVDGNVEGDRRPLVERQQVDTPVTLPIPVREGETHTIPKRRGAREKINRS